MFLVADPSKAMVMKHYKELNRELTKAYLRSMQNQRMFINAKGGALPEEKIKIREKDDETFNRVSSLFDNMMRRTQPMNRSPKASATFTTTFPRINYSNNGQIETGIPMSDGEAS